MASKSVFHIGEVKISKQSNAIGRVFFRLPGLTTISKMTCVDYWGISDRHFATANKFRESGNVSKAIKYYKKALEANPENELAHLHLGGIYSDSKKYSEAAKHYVRLIEMGKKRQPESETAKDVDNAKAIHAEGYDGLGKVFCDMGDYKTGIMLLEKSLDIQPSVSRKLALYSLLMGLYTETGNKEKAEQCQAFLYVVQ